MTAAQKANIARFKAVQAEAKKLKAKNKNLTHLQAVKQAWAIMLHKKPAAKKKAAKKVGAVKKKAAPKKKATTKKLNVRNYGSHKDTASHNVKISVMSGIENTKAKILKDISDIMIQIAFFQRAIVQNTITAKKYIDISTKKEALKNVEIQKKWLIELKKHKAELKKLL
jgi:hypothetical protein